MDETRKDGDQAGADGGDDRGWPSPSGIAGDANVYYEAAGRHVLAVGLLVLGIGLVAGIVAGPRILVTGTAAGMLLGSVYVLAWPAAMDIRDLPVGLPAVVAIVALAAGVAVALHRARTAIGVTGLGVLILGLLVLYGVFSADDPILDEDVTNVLTPILLGATVIAAVPVLASLGTVLVAAGDPPRSWTPTGQ